jgi:hypothetical protein
VLFYRSARLLYSSESPNELSSIVISTARVTTSGSPATSHHHLWCTRHKSRLPPAVNISPTGTIFLVPCNMLLALKTNHTVGLWHSSGVAPTRSDFSSAVNALRVPGRTASQVDVLLFKVRNTCQKLLTGETQTGDNRHCSPGLMIGVLLRIYFPSTICGRKWEIFNLGGARVQVEWSLVVGELEHRDRTPSKGCRTGDPRPSPLPPLPLPLRPSAKSSISPIASVIFTFENTPWTA